MKRLILIITALMLLVSCAKKSDGNIYLGTWEGKNAEIEIENGAAIFSYSLSENTADVEVTESISAWGMLEERENGAYYALFNTAGVKIKAKLTVTGEGAEEYLSNLEETLLLIVSTDVDIALAKAYCAGKEITYGIESDLFGILPEIPEELEFTLDKKERAFILKPDA